MKQIMKKTLKEYHLYNKLKNENKSIDFMKIIKKSKTGTKNQKIKTKCFRKYREIL